MYAFTFTKNNGHASIVHSLFWVFFLPFYLLCSERQRYQAMSCKHYLKLLQFVYVNLAVLPFFCLCSTVLSVIAPTAKRRNLRYTLDRWIKKCINDISVPYFSPATYLWFAFLTWQNYQAHIMFCVMAFMRGIAPTSSSLSFLLHGNCAVLLCLCYLIFDVIVIVWTDRCMLDSM